MKAKELMINDWYMNSAKEPCKVVKNFGDIVWGEGNDVADSTDEPLPIPLTPEILGQNGFWYGILPDEDDMLSLGLGVPVDIEKRWVFDNENGGTISITFPNEDDGGQVVISNDDKHLSSVWISDFNVHELQHALRLCELNNIADNFKV